MLNKHRGTTIIELIIVLGIMALISMVIATMLSSTIMLNNRISSINDKEYKSHEFYRYLSNNIKNFRVSNIVIEQNKISIFYNPAPEKSDKIEILHHNDNIELIYYEKFDETFVSSVKRVILKNINNVSFRLDKNLLYVTLYWKDGGSSLGVIDL